ncbi:MAG TPA: DUF2339 domain-containing protein [Saprospiraceae bacterium]|nr:DUF2339 domain-containing protein [Saprospiraceae bacterium]
MPSEQESIRLLEEKLQALIARQEHLTEDIAQLRTEINRVKTGVRMAALPKDELLSDWAPVQGGMFESDRPAAQVPLLPKPQPEPIRPEPRAPKAKSDLEKFIGENLINKIGIAITIIGVGIGAKYAIDHELISPLMRIIAGYVFGLAMLGVALRLKPTYTNFSAVLLSGAMAILYFITYAAHGFYDLIPQGAAYALMVLFTVFTVVAALYYNMQVIAHIGLVGAYAVPYWLGGDPERPVLWFVYIAIINAGILILAFKKYWRTLFLSAFGLTWLMFSTWYGFSYKESLHVSQSLIFSTLFFGIFYVAFLAHKLVQKAPFHLADIAIVALNSLIFFGLGYSILIEHDGGKDYCGLFALAIAAVHAVAGRVIYKQKETSASLTNLAAGMGLLFAAWAVPIQWDGNVVTLVWAGAAVLLFWTGRTRSWPFYEAVAYVFMVLASLSLLDDWTRYYWEDGRANDFRTLLNIRFLSSVLFLAAFGYIFLLNKNSRYPSEWAVKNGIRSIVSYTLPAVLLFVLYSAFFQEISDYWDQLERSSVIAIKHEEGFTEKIWNPYLPHFQAIWLLSYTLFFLTLLAVANMRLFKNKLLAAVNLVGLVIVIFAFITGGFYELSELRSLYVRPRQPAFFQPDVSGIVVRYISLAFLAAALMACGRYVKEYFAQPPFKIGFDLLLHLSVLIAASTEMAGWMDMAHSAQSNKLALSILWGVYALLLIVLGIRARKKHLRIAAIGLFGITLLKLFFYDLAHLDTISKTIVFVSLGLLLLGISFLYNKYKGAMEE